MTFPLPTSIASVSQWTFTDWRDIKATSAGADPFGVATITLDPVPDGEQWLLDRAVIQCTGALNGHMRMYANSFTALELLDGTDTGRFDVAEWPSGLLVRTAAALVIQWTGCDAGAVGRFRAQARVFRRD